MNTIPPSTHPAFVGKAASQRILSQISCIPKIFGIPINCKYHLQTITHHKCWMLVFLSIFLYFCWIFRCLRMVTWFVRRRPQRLLLYICLLSEIACIYISTTSSFAFIAFTYLGALLHWHHFEVSLPILWQIIGKEGHASLLATCEAPNTSIPTLLGYCDSCV